MKNSYHQSRPARASRGNMLILVAAVTCSALIVLLLFALAYTRLLGGSSEQRTAIEAAALAAARETSKIVINDPNFGFVSYSDAAPIGTSTKAGDGFYCPVHSINSLMGTIRLDLIIADKLNNPVMKYMAKRDLSNLKTAKDNLIIAVASAIQPGGTAQDMDGATVEPYKAAEEAYKTNVVRMTGDSNYVAGSMSMQLGSVMDGTETSTPVPKPATWAGVAADAQQNNNYMSGLNVPYDGEDFVFAALGRHIKLVDPTKFSTDLGLPCEMPSVIRVQASQRFMVNGQPRVTKAVACAQPANNYDPKPAPGALSISFPEGRLPYINTPGDLLSNPKFVTSPPMIIETSTGGDYPGTGTLAPGSFPGGGGGLNPTVTNVWSQQLYDWIRRAGVKLNAGSVVSMQAKPLLGGANQGMVNVYTVDSSGDVINNKAIAITVDPFEAVSQNQFYAYLQAFDSGGKIGKNGSFMWDVYVRDQVSVAGTINGGQHAGEPLFNPLVAAIPQQSNYICSQPCDRDEHATPIRIALHGNRGTAICNDCGAGGDGASSGGSASGSSGAGWSGGSGTGGTNVSLSFGLRGDFGGYSTPGPNIVSFPTSAVGAMRGTYLQNGSAVTIRFRKAALVKAKGKYYSKRK